MVHLGTKGNNKGYYVKMKLLHTNGNNGNNNKRIVFLYRCFRWSFWFFLSLYLFTSYLHAHLPKPNLSSPGPLITTRATMLQTNETVAVSRQSSIPQPSSASSISAQLNNMKIYIYELPSKYNTDWLDSNHQRCSSHLFASEVAIHRALMGSDVRTLNPLEADFFFVPVYLSCNFSTINGFPSMGHARLLLASAVDLISSTMPFWNRSGGLDHIFVASHDFGACFRSVEELAIKDGIPEFLMNSIILQTFGVTYPHPCQAAANVVIPPYVSPERVAAKAAPANGKRDIFAYFRGKMEVRPKNISGEFYSRKVRSRVWHKYSRNRKFYLKRERLERYEQEMGRSVFCLCPLGWAPWSPRLVESVAMGCVPVIIADGIRLPYSEAERIPWSRISVSVAEKDVIKLSKILSQVASTNLSAIQANLWDPVNRKALLYNGDGIQQGDATWQALYSVSQMLHHRSHRRR